MPSTLAARENHVIHLKQRRFCRTVENIGNTNRRLVSVVCSFHPALNCKTLWISYVVGQLSYFARRWLIKSIHLPKCLSVIECNFLTEYYTFSHASTAHLSCNLINQTQYFIPWYARLASQQVAGAYECTIRVKYSVCFEFEYKFFVFFVFQLVSRITVTALRSLTNESFLGKMHDKDQNWDGDDNIDDKPPWYHYYC